MRPVTFKIPFAATGILLGLVAQPLPTGLYVNAGAYDRHGTVVSFAPMAVNNTFQYALRDGPASIPIQIDGSERAWFESPPTSRPQ